MNENEKKAPVTMIKWPDDETDTYEKLRLAAFESRQPMSAIVRLAVRMYLAEIERGGVK